MKPAWYDKFRSYLPRAIATEKFPPLLDMEERESLQAFAAQPQNTIIHFDRNVAHQRLGDRLSKFRGQGYEFEENRRYQQGDEQRSINWRLYARRRELFSKQYIEERRPEVYVLVDRRAGMRFGTRNRIKAALAAQLATVTLLQASRQAIPAGALVLDDEAQWFSPALGNTGLQPLLDTISSACPPQPFSSEQESLQEALAQLDTRTADGCFVLLLSDFIDFDPERVMPILQRLAERHTMQAIRILDPVESKLPPISPLLLEDNTGKRALAVDDNGDYETEMIRIDNRLQECFSTCRIDLTTCYANNDWQQCIRQALFVEA